MKYVNVYSVTRHYGGPEEGGWWYNAGEPIESRLIADEDEGVPICTCTLNVRTRTYFSLHASVPNYVPKYVPRMVQCMLLVRSNGH